MWYSRKNGGWSPKRCEVRTELCHFLIAWRRIPSLSLNFLNCKMGLITSVLLFSQGFVRIGWKSATKNNEHTLLFQPSFSSRLPSLHPATLRLWFSGANSIPQPGSRDKGWPYDLSWPVGLLLTLLQNSPLCWEPSCVPTGRGTAKNASNTERSRTGDVSRQISYDVTWAPAWIHSFVLSLNNTSLCASHIPCPFLDAQHFVWWMKERSSPSGACMSVGMPGSKQISRV